ncbi:MAG: hypothetical protein ABJJ44_19550 [Paraglaciecola sp.]|uniref:hypothetical protein n=1 Tax=Paraglaciecola sp. TaxID=1920173 RepID=UPI0032980348
MARKLFLHVGPAKTGTSAIQAHFKAHECSTLYYPETGRWPDGAHHKLIFSIRQQRQYGNISIPEWQSLKDSLLAEISATPKNILISSEMCQPNFLVHIKDVIEDQQLEVVVIMVYRPSAERAASVYNQNVKDSVVGESALPDEFIKRNPQQFSVRPLFEQWQSVAPNIRLLSYRAKEPLLERFMQSVGEVSCKANNGTKFNRSMGGHALLVMLLANQLVPTEEQRRNVFEKMRILKNFNIWSGDSYPFTKAATMELQRAVQRDIDWVKQVIPDQKEVMANIEFTKRFKLTRVQCEQIRVFFVDCGLYIGSQEVIDSLLREFSVETSFKSNLDL